MVSASYECTRETRGKGKDMAVSQSGGKEVPGIHDLYLFTADS